MGFHITPEHWDSQPASPECASESVLSIKIIPPLRQSSFHTDLGGETEKLSVVVRVDISHWIQIQQIWTEHLLDPMRGTTCELPVLVLEADGGVEKWMRSQQQQQKSSLGELSS